MSFLNRLFGTGHTAIDTIITDVTRMHASNICVAGSHQDRAIRLHHPQPNDQWIRSVGGLTPGDVVSVTWKPAARISRPHVEDGLWTSSSFQKTRRVPEDELVAHLRPSAFSRVREAFGEPLFFSRNGNAGFQPGMGNRSLASVIVRSVRAYPHFESIRVDFADEQDSWIMAPLQDFTVRQHQLSCPECSTALGPLLANEFKGDAALLRVGLTREFQTEDHPPACYLQINHIFLTPSKRRHFV